MALKHHKAFRVAVYRASTPGEAEEAPDRLDAAGGAATRWCANPDGQWQHLSAYCKYPTDIRRVIYTTHSIEAVHRQFRKRTKTKGGFPNESSLLKRLYVGIENASKKWAMPPQNWNLTLSQLAIYFEGRLDGALDL